MKKNRNYELLWSKNIQKEPYNVTTKLLLPCLGMQLSTLRDSIGKREHSGEDCLKILGFRQSFSYFPDYQGFIGEEPVFLLFCPSRWSLNNYYRGFYKYLVSLNTFTDILFINSREIVVILQVQEDFRGSKDIVMRGKYSWLGYKYARTFFQPHEEMFKIIMKDENKRKELEGKIGMQLNNNAELMSIPDLEKEILRREIIKI